MQISRQKIGKGEALIMELRRHSRRRGAGLCFAFLCVLWVPGAVMALTQGEQYLNETEGHLRTIAEGVRDNDDRKCELLKTCTSTTCSRNTCLPGKDDVLKYSCVGVSLNKYCNATNVPKCMNKTFDYTRSFVRTASNTDFNSMLTTIGTCAQRALDPVFQNLSKPESLLRIYFGSNDGSFRAFPGSDQDVNAPECNSTDKFDPRLRPWYRASTSVPKVIAILVDAGRSMNRNILQGLGSGTLLEKAKTFVTEFLKSLDSEDYVNIIMFNSTGATPLSSTMKRVDLSRQTYLPASLDSLTQSLAEQTSETLSGTDSDVVQGINVALQNFGTDHPDAAKIILIFTDMEFASGPINTSIPLTNLTALNVKVFVYKIPPVNNIENSNPTFADQLCSIGGSFEAISRLSGLSNPLLALNSFFTFTAALHAKVVNNSVDYSPTYTGYELIEGNITTVSLPVFGADKMLLGVVGLDIFVEKLGNRKESVQISISKRSEGHKFNPSNFLLTRADCIQKPEINSTELCNTSVTSIQNAGGFCPRTDQTSIITDLACCGLCKPDGRRKLTAGAIAGIVVGCVVALILSGAAIWYFCSRKKQSPPVTTRGVENKPFSGPG